jgi:uncharacterized phage protein (TIGR01671 family)
MRDHLYRAFYIVEEKDNFRIFKHEVYPETVGQFTGLTDKNGVKIFEGDILLQKTTEKFKEVNPAQWERRYIVRYGYCDFDRGTAGYDTIGFFLSSTHNSYVQMGIGSIERDNLDGYYPYEVIGNIHDNPEYLREGNKS